MKRAFIDRNAIMKAVETGDWPRPPICVYDTKTGKEERHFELTLPEGAVLKTDLDSGMIAKVFIEWEETDG